MKKRETLRQMAHVTQAIYDRKRQALQKVLAEESHLRSEIARLANLAHSKDSQDTALQILGADLLWQGWLGRSKAELNMQLARVLARKEQHLTDVRMGYGKVLAVQNLGKKLKFQQHKLAERKSQEIVVEQTLHGSGR